VDVEFYSSRCLPNGRLATVPHPIVGYFGAIADWFDVDLMTRLARERPHYQFVLLGGVFGVDVRGLDALPNVSLLGQQPYADMPEYLHHFDVCLIPFRINPITQATDPVKLYEYLAAGKPVVSVALPELEPCREHVYLAASADDFLAQVDAAVAERDPARAERRRQFAAANTWAARYETIHNAVVRAVPSASIIIVTHDNLALTRLCLESVLRNTPYPACEVLVVDNASTDGTPEFLQALAAHHPDVRVILNSQNLGFARANNQALAASRGDHLVLLNNDTVVPPGWLTRLLAHLADPEVGLVGPVTNFVGNEARIEVTYTNIGEMELFAADRGRRHARKLADIPMLAMFCTAMRRDTFAQIGPLDERFGIGMFEDDDYTRRVRAAGLRVVCAADVFVHHVGQAAFKKLIAGGQYDALFEANRRSYEAKWGTWTAHRHGELVWSPADRP
jgi:GT2 family glycosyltransferase